MRFYKVEVSYFIIYISYYSGGDDNDVDDDDVLDVD
jgi:hypothetical protein